MYMSTSIVMYTYVESKVDNYYY